MLKIIENPYLSPNTIIICDPKVLNFLQSVPTYSLEEYVPWDKTLVPKGCEPYIAITEGSFYDEMPRKYIEELNNKFIKLYGTKKKQKDRLFATTASIKIATTNLHNSIINIATGA